MEYRLSPQFDLWTSRPEIQEQARAFLTAKGEEMEKLLADLEKPVLGGRCMNFGIIGAMNALYWHCEKHFQLEGIAARGDYNHLAMQPEPQWRQVIAVLAYDLGFRFQAPSGRLRA